MSSMNVVTLVGNMGKDPKIFDGNTKVAKFSIATNEFVKQEKKTEWHNIVAFGKTADIIEAYAKKGTKIGVLGRLSNGSYEKDGQTVYYTEVIANNVQLLSPKGTSEGNNFSNDQIPF
ncbi:MAG: putative single-stranded DNA-binding protein [Prokaryotic dsDNA virus sp.]|nr:MAG: putative single-stranded DNA-binding protein [Prokaryotic dsDNA virus sp.]